MPYKYEFRNAEGNPCCKSNDIKLLCKQCRAKVGVPLAARAAAATLRTTGPAKTQEQAVGIPPAVAELTAMILKSAAPDPWAEALKVRAAAMNLPVAGVATFAAFPIPPDAAAFEATLPEYVRNPPDCYARALQARKETGR